MGVGRTVSAVERGERVDFTVKSLEASGRWRTGQNALKPLILLAFVDAAVSRVRCAQKFGH